VALGVEAVDAFDGDEHREVMLGGYFQPRHTLTINLGAGAGFDGGPDLTVRTALIWQVGGH
jgi:hypothetical protein